MAKNPMQRKARNSFILGMFITLIITGSIIGLLVFKLININKENKEKEQGLKNAYVLVTDIKSGDSIKLENLKKVDIETNIIPSNAITLSQIEENTIAKIDLKTGTILSSDMITNSDDKTTNDTRVQEYNMILLPSQINTNEYVDIRLRLPSGLDYIVVSKKKIEIPQVLGVASESTFSVKLNESETQTMSSAIVESYIMEGSILYVAKYVEPGIQGSSVPTYVPSTAVQEAIRHNSNITVEARNALVTRFNESITTRNSINSVLNTYNDKSKENVEKSVEEEVNKAMQERKKYLDALSK
ncbi:MAG: SAF domain-containing protein [Clostridia bacterium]